MTRGEFFTMIESRAGRYDAERIHWAYWLAKHVHREEKRKTGERYFEHVRRVAYTLIQNPAYNHAFDTEEIIIGLLHDCEEDGFMPKDLLDYLFGSFVAEGIALLSKVYVQTDATGIVISKMRKNDAEYYAGLKDADRRIRRVKIADRLDNIRSMEIWTKEKQKEYIDETEKYIIPLYDVVGDALPELLRNECQKWKQRL